ncbi:hypothetical protein VTG60DRAFT_2246 [Thermothelomyces hinnuleus]
MSRINQEKDKTCDERIQLREEAALRRDELVISPFGGREVLRALVRHTGTYMRMESPGHQLANSAVSNLETSPKQRQMRNRIRYHGSTAKRNKATSIFSLSRPKLGMPDRSAYPPCARIPQYPHPVPERNNRTKKVSVQNVNARSGPTNKDRH